LKQVKHVLKDRKYNRGGKRPWRSSEGKGGLRVDEGNACTGRTHYGTKYRKDKKKFVPVISRKKDIEETLKRLHEKLANIKSEIEKATGEDKSVIIIT